MKWVDGGKPLFKVSTHLVSTVYTQVSASEMLVCFLFVLNYAVQWCFLLLNLLIFFYMNYFSHWIHPLLCPQDQHLHNFFQHCESTVSVAQSAGGELVKYLKV